MSALGLNSTKNYPSVNILPAQRSLVLADSKYRRRNKVADAEGNISQVETETESPYNFQANFSAALVGKQIIYQKLYWNQPIYSHNNESVELRFQINGDTSTTYVVYALPFVMYNEYDGAPPGIPWPVPELNSYASMMELGFNGDVRLLNSNLQLTVPPPPATDYGWLYDANGFQMTVYFRYSPAQGFSISFAPSINPAIPVYTIRLLPCSYIANAHFVHGFGIFDESVSTVNFVPRDQWTVAYFSDDTPNLLPFRYITIRSSELTKDRRMISFQNANANRFGNEISIIALSPVYTGTYHTENVGDDATVISKRDDYQPQVARIIIADESGFPIICDSPLSNLMQTPEIVNDYTKSTFLAGPRTGRGDVNFVNALIFGVQNVDIAPIASPIPVEIAQSLSASPFGMNNYLSAINTLFQAPVVGSQKAMNNNFWTWWNDPIASPSRPNMARQTIPIIVNSSNSPVSFPVDPDSYTYAGLNSTVVSQLPFSMYGEISNNPFPPEVSVFTWDPFKNSAPAIALDANLYPYDMVVGGDTPQFGDVRVFIIGYSYTVGDIILASNAIHGLSFFPAYTSLTLNSLTSYLLTLNPLYAGITDVQDIAFYFTFQMISVPPSAPGTLGYAKVGATFPAGFPPATPWFKFYNANLLNVQTEYVPPATNNDQESGYEFGNPQAIAKCEELIHEFAMILDKN